MSINMTNLRTWVTITSVINKVIKHKIAGLELQGHQDLKVTTTIARSMDIDPLNVDQSLCGHQTNQNRPKIMDITTIGTTTLGIAAITIRNMDTFLRITLEHILVATTIGG